jgi:signal transduction histidine kinase/HPt (histidine-containing phosphotransfer) domain-containing protein/FixJ family two-component response regulator
VLPILEYRALTKKLTLPKHFSEQAISFCESLPSPALLLGPDKLCHFNTRLRGLNLGDVKLSELINTVRDSLQNAIHEGASPIANTSFRAIETQNQTYLVSLSSSAPVEQGKRYNAMVKALHRMSEAVLIVDEFGYIDFCNDTLFQLFSYLERPSVEGQRIGNLFTLIAEQVLSENPKRAKAFGRLLKRKLKQKQAINFSFKNTDSRYIEYRDTVSEAGERICMFIDESSIMFLHEQLELAYTESLSLSKAKSSFMAAMSHEVKTPLNAMIGILDLCALEPQFAKHEYISRLSSSADHLLRLVNDVLDFTKFDAEKVSLSKVRCEVRPLFEQIALDQIALCEHKGIHLSLFIDPELPTHIEVDDIRISQILNNLISNAIKFSPNEHGHVSISIEKNSESSFLLSVTDNGIGIAGDKQETIFESFSQASTDIHRTFGGSGLGLSICKQICDLMEGKIEVDSELGRGTQFSVTLPLHTDDEPFKLSLQKTLDCSKTLLTDDAKFYDSLQKYQPYFDSEFVFIENIEDISSANKVIITNKEIHHGEPQNSLFHLGSNPYSLGGSSSAIINRSPLLLNQIVHCLQSGTSHDNSSTKTVDTSTLFEHTHTSILFVEDNPNNLFVIKEQAKALGLNAHFAHDGHSALECWQKYEFDVVITDYQMPGMSGAELISTLRSYESSYGLPPNKMFVLTADKTEDCEYECNKAGADKIIMKPISVTKLHALIGLVSPENGEDKAIEATTSLEIDDTAPFEELDFAWDTKSVFDISVIHEILDESDAGEIADFLKMYMDNIEQSVVQLEYEISSGKFSQAGQTAHSMKSSAKVAGNHPMFLSCEKLEDLCKTDNAEEIGQLFMQVTKQLDDSLIDIKNWIRNEIDD